MLSSSAVEYVIVETYAPLRAMDLSSSLHLAFRKLILIGNMSGKRAEPKRHILKNPDSMRLSAFVLIIVYGQKQNRYRKVPVLFLAEL